MNRFKMIIAGLGALAASVAPALQADEWNRETRITLDQPIQVENTLLAKGQYVFRLIESDSDRHIVQIYSADGTQLNATILGIPAYRLEPTGTSQFSLANPEGDGPAILRSWFYPGDNVGLEFPAAERSSVIRRTSDPDRKTQNDSHIADSPLSR